MPDEIDLASEQEQMWLSKAIANAVHGAPRLAPKGQCYFCEATFDKASPDASKKLFCDADCASDHERETRLKNRR